MNTMIRNIKTRNDENDTANYMNVKKVGGDDVKATELPKRAALGDLQNRPVQSRAGAVGKDALQKNLKDAKVTAIREVKPRVDSHWKKGTFPTTTTTTTANSPTKTTTTISTRAHARHLTSGVLTRSNSLRQAATKVTNVLSATTAISGIQRQGAVATTAAAAIKSKKIKTVTTKLVENKLQQVKIITREKTQSAVDTKLKSALAHEVKSDVSNGQSLKNSAAVIKAEIVPKVIESTSKLEEECKGGAAVTTTAAKNVINTVTVCDEPSSKVANKNIRNIDEGDDEILILVSEYVNDIYEYLFQLEIEQPIAKNHLGNQLVVTPKMRAVLLDWINEVHSQFHLVIETFHMTVAIIDRYLQKVNNTQRTSLQLVGVTALFLAAKYEELYPPSMADFIYMTDHTYNQQQILEMEIQIFRTLDCNLSRPLSIHFLRRFSKAADIEDYQHAMSKYFLELAAIDYKLASYKPSEIAAASLFLSLHLSKGDPKCPSGFNNSYWNETLEHYSHYTADHLRPITQKIASIARLAPNEKLTAVYNKYQSSKLYKASLRPVLYSELMDSIIASDD